MPSEELPEAQYERLKKQLQASILRDYPNPERRGCPGDVVVRELAVWPLDEGIERDPNWHHVTHCAECYREYLEFRGAGRQRAKARRRLVWSLVTATAAGICIYIYLAFRPFATTVPSRPQIAELQYRKTMVDIESMTRSEQAAGTKKPILLEREPKELTIRLPVGSRRGTYEFQFRDASGKTVLATKADATIRDGATEFVVRLDLSGLAAGEYSMHVRRVPFDWTYYPVVLR